MAERYPRIPGAKGPDGTSQNAGEAITPTVAHLRRTALSILARLVEATPLECCTAARLPRETLQPRFSELRAMAMIEATGARRRNPSGHSAAVLRITEKGRAAL